MGVLHHAEDVAERVDHRRADEGVAEVAWRLEERGAQLDQAGHGRLDVVDVPVHERAGRAGLLVGGAGADVAEVGAVEDAQLVLVVADPELDVGGGVVDLADEVGLDAEQLGVSAPGRREVVGEEGDGGEASQHDRSFLQAPVGATRTILLAKVLTF